MTQLTMGKALTAGLHRAMTDDDRLIVMGRTSVASAACSASPTASSASSGRSA